MASFTKKAIVASFLKICAVKSPDKITVRDIVDDCEINRNTFYYYFQDIYALIEEVLFIWNREFTESCLTDETPEVGLQSVMEWALEHKKAVMNLYRALDGSVLEDYYWNATADAWAAWLRRVSAERPVSEEAVNYVSLTCAGCFFGVLRRWLKHSMRDDPILLVDRYGKTVLCDAVQMVWNYESSFGK